jgi:hypothetical protein
VHGTQAVVSDEYARDVVDMLRRLDQKASEYHDMQIYLGLPLQSGQEVNYEGLYQEAENRRREQRDLTERYARRLVELEESGLDRELVGYEADEFLRTELLKTAQHDPDKAEMMFNTETAEGFRRANELEAQGQLQAARDLRLQVEENAPPAGGCGAGGSCGLEKMTQEEEKAAKELLNTKSDEKTVKDTERACTSCGKKTVVYAWNDKVLKKGCTSCKITEGVRIQDEAKKKSLFAVTVRRPQKGQIVTVLASGDKAVYANKKAA